MLVRIRSKLKEWREKGFPTKVVRALALALVALVVCLAISIGMQLNIHHRYSNAASLMQEQTYQHLIQMTELFSRVEEPEVDERNKLVPALTAQYSAVSALNSALTQGFGASRAVLSQEQVAAFDAAFQEYSEAYRLGMEADLARTDMRAALAEVQLQIDARYAPKVKPTDPPVIIDGSSGEIANP